MSVAPPPAPPRTWVLPFLLLAALWGSSFLFMRLGASAFGPLATAGLRVGIAALALAPVLAMRRHRDALRGRWARVVVLGTFNSALPFALYAYAVVHVPTGIAAILNATVPLFGALIAWVWLHERPGPARCAGLAIGFAGVALLVGRGVPTDVGVAVLPVLACLGAACSYGIGASYARRMLPGLPPTASAAGSMVGATLVLALPTAVAWPARMPDPGAWAAVVALAVPCTALAYLLFFRIIARAGAGRALTVTYLIPVFALGYGVLLLGEPITGWMLGCGAVVLVGTLLASGMAGDAWSRRRTAR